VPGRSRRTRACYPPATTSARLDTARSPGQVLHRPNALLDALPACLRGSLGDDKGGPATSDTASQIRLAEEHLDQTEDRLEKVQAVLDDVRQVLIAAERAQAAAERARSGLRKAEVVVVAGAIALVVLAVVSRKGQ
jgi:hypothetical protein